MTLPEFSIDTVLEALVKAGGKKIDRKPGESRCCPDGSWSIKTDPPCCEHYEHLTTPEKQRLQMLSIRADDKGQLHLMFDPDTRRIQAMEVTEIESGGNLLTLLFWPGMTTARELYRTAIDSWEKAMEDGWFEGVV